MESSKKDEGPKESRGWWTRPITLRPPASIRGPSIKRSATEGSSLSADGGVKEVGSSGQTNSNEADSGVIKPLTSQVTAPDPGIGNWRNGAHTSIKIGGLNVQLLNHEDSKLPPLVKAQFIFQSVEPNSVKNASPVSSLEEKNARSAGTGVSCTTAQVGSMEVRGEKRPLESTVRDSLAHDALSMGKGDIKANLLSSSSSSNNAGLSSTLTNLKLPGSGRIKTEKSIAKKAKEVTKADGKPVKEKKYRDPAGKKKKNLYPPAPEIPLPAPVQVEGCNQEKRSRGRPKKHSNQPEKATKSNQPFLLHSPSSGPEVFSLRNNLNHPSQHTMPISKKEESTLASSHGCFLPVKSSKERLVAQQKGDGGPEYERTEYNPPQKKECTDTSRNAVYSHRLLKCMLCTTEITEWSSEDALGAHIEDAHKGYISFKKKIVDNAVHQFNSSNK